MVPFSSVPLNGISTPDPRRERCASKLKRFSLQVTVAACLVVSVLVVESVVLLFVGYRVYHYFDRRVIKFL